MTQSRVLYEDLKASLVLILRRAFPPASDPDDEIGRIRVHADPRARLPSGSSRRTARSPQPPDAGIGVRLPPRRRLQARDLRPVGRLLQEARGVEPVHEAGRGRQDDAGPDDVLRADLDPGQPGEDRSLPRDRAPPGAPAGPDRGRGAPAGARRQGVRPHRRRPALDRSRRPAAHAAARSTTCVSTANEPDDEGDARQRRR